jgi:hypothetical protein
LTLSRITLSPFSVAVIHMPPGNMK